MSAAVFLDRDGTIIREMEYLANPAAVELLPGAGEALRSLQDAGYALVVVTNQSGIARGLFSEDDFRAVQAQVSLLLEEYGVQLDAVMHCPHHPDITGPCDCRKPGLGMYRRAAQALGIDLAASAYIGDRPSDVVPATVTGGRGFLVRTGYGASQAGNAPADVQVVDDLAEAARILIGRHGAGGADTLHR